MKQVPNVAGLGVVICLLAALGCGGGSSGGGSNGSLDIQPVWEQPSGGGDGSELPAAIHTVRIVFVSDAGLRCCLALDPRTVPVDSGSGLRLLVLDALPPGPGTLRLSAYVTDFAPAAQEITDMCPTNPANVGQRCDTTRVATPSFESDPHTVMITPGTRAASPEINVHALPFLIDLHPEQGDSAESPVPIAFTAVDAATGIDGNSIAIEASFRSLTKRVPITLSACDDNTTTTTPCSAQGQLQVSGFHAVAAPLQLPPGVVSLRIVVQNQALPPRQLDFSYDFTVAGNAGIAAGQSQVAPQEALQPPPSPVLEPHPSRRSQEKGPPQGERGLFPENNNRTARPEEPPSFGGVSKGASVTPTPMSRSADFGPWTLDFGLLCPTPTPTATPTAAQPVEGAP